MKLFPFPAAQIAASWEASAAIGTAMSPGKYSSSNFSGSGKSASGSHSIFPDIRLRTILLRFKSSARLRMSLHMMNWLKEKSPRKAISTTSQRALESTACRMVEKTFFRSIPFSSRGRGSSPPMVIPKSCRSISSRVMFIWGSSSRRRITYPLWADFRTISMGSSTSGAYLAFSLTSDSYHFKNPSARYRVLEPFSSKLVRACRQR